MSPSRSCSVLAGQALGAVNLGVLLERAASPASQTSAGWRMLAVWVTAEIQPLDAISGLRLRQLLAELRGRVTAAIPRAALVFLTPVVAVEPPPEPTPWDTDYWLRRFSDHEQA